LVTRSSALLEVSGRGSESDLRTAWRVGVLYSDFPDGQVGEIRTFMHWSDALDALGLSE
jgi:hypothetical protein